MLQVTYDSMHYTVKKHALHYEKACITLLKPFNFSRSLCLSPAAASTTSASASNVEPARLTEAWRKPWGAVGGVAGVAGAPGVVPEVGPTAGTM